jgi:YEATS domain-containing protein 4
MPFFYHLNFFFFARQFYKPISYGNYSEPIDKRGEQQFYRWSLFVRSPVGGDLSCIINTVTFQLHTDFKNPKRVVKKPPFEVNEEGWGAFAGFFLGY